MSAKRILFARASASGGTELWATDGTPAGTYQVQDIRPGSGSSSPTGFTVLGGSVLFSADDGLHGAEPWISDGTVGGTHLLADLTPGTAGSGLAGLATLPGQGWVFTTADSTRLWATDGTAAGTGLIASLPINIPTGVPPAALGQQVIFQATDFAHGTEPWITDGTAAGTHLLLDIAPGGSSSPAGFTPLGDKVLFWADDGNGPEPWITNGSSASKLAAIRPGFGSVDLTPDLKAVVSGGKAYFQADDGVRGAELWVTDGTAGGTQLYADLNPGFFGSKPTPLGVVNGLLLFAADSGGSAGRELWATHGNDAPFLLADINGAGGSNPRAMVSAGSFALFLADSSDGRDQLWITDGTAAGTHLLLADSTGWLNADGMSNAAALTIPGGTPGNDNLQADAAGSPLQGLAGDDTLTGQSGDDTLDGGTGADHLAGGPGNDLYVVDNPADLVTEQPGAGQDSILASITLTLPANVEALTLAPGAGPLAGTGNALANLIIGNEAANRLDGAAGNDTLIGGAGIDRLLGGAGNDRLDGTSALHETDWLAGGTGDDLYLIDSRADRVVEQPGAGSDTVLAAVDVSLPANVEALVLTGTARLGQGNALDNSLTGNGVANWLLGGDGNDTIDGGAGNDVLQGGAGADLFILAPGSGADRILDFVPGADHIRVGALKDFAALLAATSNHLGSAVIALGSGDSVTLAGVTKEALSAGDFLFS